MLWSAVEIAFVALFGTLDSFDLDCSEGPRQRQPFGRAGRDRDLAFGDQPVNRPTDLRRFEAFSGFFVG